MVSLLLLLVEGGGSGAPGPGPCWLNSISIYSYCRPLVDCPFGLTNLGR